MKRIISSLLTLVIVSLAVIPSSTARADSSGIPKEPTITKTVLKTETVGSNTVYTVQLKKTYYGIHKNASTGSYPDVESTVTDTYMGQTVTFTKTADALSIVKGTPVNLTMAVEFPYRGDYFENNLPTRSALPATIDYKKDVTSLVDLPKFNTVHQVMDDGTKIDYPQRVIYKPGLLARVSDYKNPASETGDFYKFTYHSRFYPPPLEDGTAYNDDQSYMIDWNDKKTYEGTLALQYNDPPVHVTSDPSAKGFWTYVVQDFIKPSQAAADDFKSTNPTLNISGWVATQVTGVSGYYAGGQTYYPAMSYVRSLPQLQDTYGRNNPDVTFQRVGTATGTWYNDYPQNDGSVRVRYRAYVYTGSAVIVGHYSGTMDPGDEVTATYVGTVTISGGQAPSGDIVFDPNSTYWTNKGKISNGVGCYTVNVKYTGTYPHTETATGSYHQSIPQPDKPGKDAKGNPISIPQPNKEVDTPFSFTVTWHMNIIMVLGAGNTNIYNSPSGTVDIKQEGNNLSMMAFGGWKTREGTPPPAPQYTTSTSINWPPDPDPPRGQSGIYMIDWTDPVISVAPNSSGWQQNMYNLNYSITDALSGIDHATATLTDSSHYRRNASSTNPIGNFYLNDGIYSLRLYGEDLATNNSTSNTAQYLVDTHVPVINSLSSQSTNSENYDCYDTNHTTWANEHNYRSGYPMSFTLGENLSGFHNTSYTLTDSSYYNHNRSSSAPNSSNYKYATSGQTDQQSTYSQSFSLLDGLYSLAFHFEDVAQNTSASSFSEYKVDITKPYDAQFKLGLPTDSSTGNPLVYSVDEKKQTKWRDNEFEYMCDKTNTISNIKYINVVNCMCKIKKRW